LISSLLPIAISAVEEQAFRPALIRPGNNRVLAPASKNYPITNSPNYQICLSAHICENQRQLFSSALLSVKILLVL